MITNFYYIKLSSDFRFYKDTKGLITKYKNIYGFQFLLHNYFPQSRKTFVLNLASDDIMTLKASREHCKKAIDLCDELEVLFFSVHAGFCFNAGEQDLGREQTKLPRINIDIAERIFLESMKILSEYAKDCNVKIAIENNVIAHFNLIDGRNLLFLGVQSEDLLRIFKKIRRENVYMLLDVGHLKISAHSLGFDPVEFVQVTAPYTIAVHLSENDGKTDSNMPILQDSWFWAPLKQYLTPDVYYILESYNLRPEEIKTQLSLISDNLTSEG